jgi:ferrous iron transport protein B
VVPTVARGKEGLERLLDEVLAVARGERSTAPLRIARHAPAVDEALGELVPRLRDEYPELDNARWVALRLLSGDERVIEAVRSGEIGRLDATDAEADSSGPVPDRPADDSGDREAILRRAAFLRSGLPTDVHDRFVERIFTEAERVADAAAVRGLRKAGLDFDRTLDRLLTSRLTGIPIMLGLLALVFWITIAGANVPSAFLSELLIGKVHPLLHQFGDWIALPAWLSGVLFDGAYLATAWVVSVMLPPMAIFFPLFTLLEDLGYLPRVAFNMDSLFRRVGAHGKQALTMAMGFGCNAAGVVATRVIDSPRERLIAIITNNFSLCNGRWPTQILIASIFVGAVAPAALAGVVSAATVVGVALLGIGAMLVTSWFLSRTMLRGEASTFSLELPPYRPPRILQTLYTSVIDRTLIVLWRAVVFALPAGVAIWLVANIHVGGASVAEHVVATLNPFGRLIGLNGVILLAFVVAIPANEIVIPTVLMLTVLTAGMTGVGEGAGVMFELESTGAVHSLLTAGGWTLLTGVCLMLFSLLHNPCSTTIYTIYKETGSVKWTAVATVLPLLLGFAVCFLVAQGWRLLA